MYIMNNKGGVGISCRVWDTVCFINSYLAAHDDMHKRRTTTPRLLAGAFGEKPAHQAFHHLVWMGDLNYRASGGRTRRRDQA